MTVLASSPDTDDSVEPAESPSSTSRIARLRSTWSAMGWPVKLATVWLVFVVGGALWGQLDQLLGDALPLADPYYQGVLFGESDRLEPSSFNHFLGTDTLSRDTFSRSVNGAWVSLIISLFSAGFGVIFGGLIGSSVGYFKGRIGTATMAMIDVVLAFPPLILLLAVVTIWNARSLPVIALVFGLLAIPSYTRVARAAALTISNREFVMAAKAIGTSQPAILFREILPNVLPTLLAYALVASANVLVIEGSLSFLGLSVQLPEPSWGNMINEGRGQVKVTIMPIVWPSLFLTFTVLSLNQVGDFLQRRSAIRSSAL